MSFNWEKKIEQLWVRIWVFKSWHNRFTLYLILACIKKHFSKEFSFHLCFISELSVCPNCVNLDIVWLGLRVRLVTCVLQIVTVCYIVTFLARLVDCVEIVQGVSRGFFYLGWARGFLRKNRVFIIPLNFCFLLCQEQPVQTGSQAVCKNFANFVKTQFTPLLCFVISNLTIPYLWQGLEGTYYISLFISWSKFVMIRILICVLVLI